MNGGPTYIPYCVDDIALQLLGPEMLDENGRLHIRFRGPVQAITQRTWYNLARRLDRATARFDALEVQVLAAFNGEYAQYHHFPIADILSQFDRAQPKQIDPNSGCLRDSSCRQMAQCRRAYQYLRNRRKGGAHGERARAIDARTGRRSHKQAKKEEIDIVS